MASSLALRPLATPVTQIDKNNKYNFSSGKHYQCNIK